jgi:phage-related protein
MAVFDWGETSASEEATPRTNAMRFGNGYEQRSPDGINNMDRSWSLRFDDCSPEVGDEIIAFLEARNGVEVFDWTPKWRTSALKVICTQWSRTKGTRPMLQSITARFDQRYEP